MATRHRWVCKEPDCDERGTKTYEDPAVAEERRREHVQRVHDGE